MNNRFKFRVWDKYHKQWIGACAIELDGTIIDIHNAIPDTNWIAQQYTGLTDSKETEICEGDILKINYDTFGNVIGQVIYEADHGGYILQYKRNRPNQNYINLNCDVAFESVIVGNIFEHKHLLEK